MTHRGPFQPLLFCDSVKANHDKAPWRAWQQESGFYKMHPKARSGLRLSWDLPWSIQWLISTRITYSKHHSPGTVWGSRAENNRGRPKRGMGELRYLLHYPVRGTTCH